MRFNSEAYEKAFPREASTPKTPEPIKQGNVLEEADKVIKPEPEKTPEPEDASDPESNNPGGGAADGD